MRISKLIRDPAASARNPHRGVVATAKACSRFPFSGTTLSTLSYDLASYSQTKFALQFDRRRPLPVALAHTLINAHMAETATRPR